MFVSAHYEIDYITKEKTDFATVFAIVFSSVLYLFQLTMR